MAQISVQCEHCILKVSSSLHIYWCSPDLRFYIQVSEPCVVKICLKIFYFAETFIYDSFFRGEDKRMVRIYKL